jgi:hypothetical protein
MTPFSHSDGLSLDGGIEGKVEFIQTLDVAEHRRAHASFDLSAAPHRQLR